MTFLRWIAGTLFAIAAVLFAVANLADVSVVWSPFHPALVMPLSVFGLGMAAVGFVAGGVLVWINGQSVRCDLRARKKQIRDLESALDSANENTLTPVRKNDSLPPLLSVSSPPPTS